MPVSGRGAECRRERERHEAFEPDPARPGAFVLMVRQGIPHWLVSRYAHIPNARFIAQAPFEIILHVQFMLRAVGAHMAQ
jgi:hypothetical protein